MDFYIFFPFLFSCRCFTIVSNEASASFVIVQVDTCLHDVNAFKI